MLHDAMYSIKIEDGRFWANFAPDFPRFRRALGSLTDPSVLHVDYAYEQINNFLEKFSRKSYFNISPLK